MQLASHMVPVSRFRSLLATLALALQALAPAPAYAQPVAPRDPEPAARLPFPVGEVLDYRVNVAVGGNIGQGQMRVEGPVMERGTPSWRLVSEMRAKRAFVKATDRTISWVDPARFATLRFEKRERHPLSSSDEAVEMDLLAGVWRDERGQEQALGSPLPLDELSFLYFLRTLPLDRESTQQFSRHFDDSRNPTLVTVGPEEVVQTDVGRFTTRVVIMHVRDPRHYKGVGLIRLNLDTSGCHVPVRIVSRMPIVGTTTLTLVARSGPTGTCEP